jgi:DNA-directed RNA polymerase subunit RPC12/RpoP
MAIHIKCEHCGHILNVPDDMEGKAVRCPNCDRKTIARVEVEKPPDVEQTSLTSYNSMRVMGRVFVFVGYILAIVAVAFGLDTMVRLSEQGWTRDSLIGFLKYFVAAMVIFVICKFAGELSRAIADIAENQASISRTLRELQERLGQPAKG